MKSRRQLGIELKLSPAPEGQAAQPNEPPFVRKRREHPPSAIAKRKRENGDADRDLQDEDQAPGKLAPIPKEERVSPTAAPTRKNPTPRSSSVTDLAISRSVSFERDQSLSVTQAFCIFLKGSASLEGLAYGALQPARMSCVTQD